MKIIELLNQRRRGFNGVTHILIGVLIYFVVFSLSTLDIAFIDGFVSFITRDVWTVLISFFIVTGGSLFPDLDSSRSTAEFRLGTTGKLISSFMVFSGKLIWGLYHLRRDKRVSYMHRAIYHTPFLLFVFWLLFYFNIPQKDAVFIKELGDLSVKDLPAFFVNNFVVIFVIFSSYLFIRLSIATITYRPFKRVFRKQFIADIAAILLSLPPVFEIMSMTYNDIRTVSYLLILGYGTHLLGDLFTRGSIPLFYPIPIRREAYYRPSFPLQIPTNEGPSRVTNKVIAVLIVIILIYNLYNIDLHLK